MNLSLIQSDSFIPFTILHVRHFLLSIGLGNYHTELLIIMTVALYTPPTTIN